MVTDNISTADDPGFSVKEAAALAGISEPALRTQKARGFFTPFETRRRSGRPRTMSIPMSQLVFMALIAKLGETVSGPDRRAIARIIGGRESESGGWRLIRGYLVKEPIRIDLKPIRMRCERAARGYARGRARAVSDPGILGGTLVFKGTRIMVRHIGEMLLNGVPEAEVRADFPKLSADDLIFARIHARLPRGPGRPSKPLVMRRAAA